VTEYEDQVLISVTGDRKIRVVARSRAGSRRRQARTDYGLAGSRHAGATWNTPTPIRSADAAVLAKRHRRGARRDDRRDFSRPGRSMSWCKLATTDLGDIVVEGGRTITGRVVDDRGAPVAGAMVAITKAGPSLYEYDDETLKRRLGEPFARTDATGRYQIQGVPAGDDLLVEASHALGIAPGRRLTGDTIDLVIARVGVVEGVVANFNDDQLNMRATSLADPAIYFTADLDRAGNFRFSRLPAGDYHVRLRGKNTRRRCPRRRGSRSVISLMPGDADHATVQRRLLRRRARSRARAHRAEPRSRLGETHVRRAGIIRLSTRRRRRSTSRTPQRQTFVLPAPRRSRRAGFAPRARPRRRARRDRSRA
jgi:hypothetical protein